VCHTCIGLRTFYECAVSACNTCSKHTLIQDGALQGYARRIASESLDAGAGFTVDLALKDVRYMRQLAEASRCPLRVAGERG
jgi:3-hydroxyisobutyrate dehydrogenase-like beta-hydroxyacid dehydrogenase